MAKLRDVIMELGIYSWKQFQSNSELSVELADVIAGQLTDSIARHGSAVIAVSGGSTPKPLFQQLSTLDVAWSKVIFTLVDERWVDEDHELSNAAFLKTNFLSLLPQESNFVPLYHSAESVEASLSVVLKDYCSVTQSDLASPRPFDVVVLGMGADGHTASFFPDAENIAHLINPENEDFLLSCESASTQVPRITWSLPMLLNTQFLALHITGEAKRRVFEQAVTSDDALELPIRAVIYQQQTAMSVYYAD